MKKKHSQNDVDYFNTFKDGYSPYSEKDIEVITKPLMNIIKKKPGPLRFCEVGCADGQFSYKLEEMLKPEKNMFLGIDIAQKALLNFPFEKVCGSAFSLPIRNNSLDIVLLPAALHHLYPFGDSVKELSRVLVKGGYLYCLEPNIMHPQRMFFVRYQRLYNLYREANDVPINPRKQKTLFEKNSLDVIFFKYVNLYFRKPSKLMRIQNAIASKFTPGSFDKFILPWFIMVAQKR